MMKKLMTFAAAVLFALTAAGCGSSNTVSGLIGKTITPENGYAEGKLGDTMRTAWFDLKTNSAKLVSGREDYQPSEGNVLLVVNITLNSTYDSDVQMFDTDFQAQWGSEGDEDYRVPITYYHPDLSFEGMLEESYTLEAGKSVTGDLVFEVPGGMKSYSLSFQEYFDNDKTGDLFFIYFDAE